MGQIKYSSDVAAPVDIAFSYVDNYVFVPDWLFGVSRFEPTGDLDQGLGAVFETSAQFGPFRHNFETEVTAYQRNVTIGLTGRSGMAGTLTFHFDQLGCGRSILAAELDFEPPRGISGRLTDKLVAAFGNTAVRHTESRLRKGIEQYHGHALVGRIA